MNVKQTVKAAEDYISSGKWLIKVKLMIATLIVASFLFSYLDVHFQKRVETKTEERETLIPITLNSPIINQISEYICLRNSKVPEEVALLEAKAFVEVAEDKDISYKLLVAIAETESLFNPMEKSSAGAIGLMQILRGRDSQGKEVIIDVDKAFDIKYNVKTGAEILQGKLNSAKKNLYLGLSMYSNYSKEYPETVLQNVGRFTMFVERKTIQQEETALVGNTEKAIIAN